MASHHGTSVRPPDWQHFWTRGHASAKETATGHHRQRGRPKRNTAKQSLLRGNLKLQMCGNWWFEMAFFGGGSSVWLWFVWIVLLRISYLLTNRSLDHEVVFSPNKNIQKPGNWGLVKALLGWYVDGTWKNYVLLTMAIRGIDVEFQRYIFQTHILLSCLFQRDEHGNWHGSEV